jgi:hypothetical protein
LAAAVEAARPAARAMNSMMLSILLYMVLGLVAAAAVLLMLRAANRPSVFRARPLMTDNEIEFFRRLCAAWPDGYVFPQVAMSALLKPAGATSRAHRAALNRISQKRVDYAIYTADLELHCIVELDDRSRNAQRDARRDTWLASAGIVTLRFTPKDKLKLMKERLLNKESSTAPPRKISAPNRPSTMQATTKARPGTVNTRLPAGSTAAARPGTLGAAKPQAAGPATLTAPPARPAAAEHRPKPAPAPAPAPTTDELELLEFVPATQAPSKR